MAAAFARAAHTVDRKVLTRMGEILKTAQIDLKAESAALALRDAWMTKRIGISATEQYLKTEAAIRAFAERRPIKTLQQPGGELFLIPKLPSSLRYDTSKKCKKGGPQVRQHEDTHARTEA
jgi:hypothetical protein